MKFVGAAEIGPLIPNTASWMCWPGFTRRAITSRFAAFQPLTTEPPLCAGARGSSPSTQISA
jgi:hypothetical protein